MKYNYITSIFLLLVVIILSQFIYIYFGPIFVLNDEMYNTSIMEGLRSRKKKKKKSSKKKSSEEISSEEISSEENNVVQRFSMLKYASYITYLKNKRDIIYNRFHTKGYYYDVYDNAINQALNINKIILKTNIMTIKNCADITNYMNVINTIVNNSSLYNISKIYFLSSIKDGPLKSINAVNKLSSICKKSSYEKIKTLISLSQNSTDQINALIGSTISTNIITFNDYLFRSIISASILNIK